MHIIGMDDAMEIHEPKFRVLHNQECGKKEAQLLEKKPRLETNVDSAITIGDHPIYT